MVVFSWTVDWFDFRLWPSGLIWCNLENGFGVLEEYAASAFRAVNIMSTQMIVAVCCYTGLIITVRLHGVTVQKTIIWTLSAMNIPNLSQAISHEWQCFLPHCKIRLMYVRTASHIIFVGICWQLRVMNIHLKMQNYHLMMQIVARNLLQKSVSYYFNLFSDIRISYTVPDYQPFVSTFNVYHFKGILPLLGILLICAQLTYFCK